MSRTIGRAARQREGGCDGYPARPFIETGSECLRSEQAYSKYKVCSLVGIRSKLTQYIPERRLSELGWRREFPLTNAACMSRTAVVNCEGVGDVKSAASKLPTTWLEVADVPEGDLVKENPVSDVPEAGLTPTFPATM